MVVGVAGGHVLAAAWDQFVGNVMRGEGGLHQVNNLFESKQFSINCNVSPTHATVTHILQVLRDLGFMVPDLLHILLPILELSRQSQGLTLSHDCPTFRYADVRRIPPAYLISNGLAAATVATMGGIWLFSICL